MAHEPPIALTIVAADVGIATGRKWRPRRWVDRLDRRRHDHTECRRTWDGKIGGVRTEQLHLPVDTGAPTFSAGVRRTKSSEQQQSRDDRFQGRPRTCKTAIESTRRTQNQSPFRIAGFGRLCAIAGNTPAYAAAGPFVRSRMAAAREWVTSSRAASSR